MFGLEEPGEFDERMQNEMNRWGKRSDIREQVEDRVTKGGEV